MDYLPCMKCAKWLKNALRLHICTAEQLEKGNRSAATPSSPAHLPSRSTNSADLLWKERVGWRASFDCAHPVTKVYYNIKPVLSLNTWKSSQWLTLVADRGVVTIRSVPLHSAWEHVQSLFPQSLCLGQARECCPMYSKSLSRSFKVWLLLSVQLQNNVMVSAKLALHECPLQATAALAELLESSSKYCHVAKALRSKHFETQTCCSEPMISVNLKSNFLWYKAKAIASEDSPLMKCKWEERFSEPRWEAVFSGTSKEFGREEPVSETNIPCRRYKSCFPELITCSHFTSVVLVAHQDLSQQKSVSKVPLTLMGSKQVLNCTWPQNSSRQRSSPAQHSSQTRPKQLRSRHGAVGRDQSSQTMRNRAEGQSSRTSTPRKCSTDQQLSVFVYLLDFHWVTINIVEKVSLFCKIERYLGKNFLLKVLVIGIKKKSISIEFWYLVLKTIFVS